MTPQMKKAVSVDAYLADLPDDARATLEKIRRAIEAVAPKATETIAYGMPAFAYAGRPLVYHAAFKPYDVEKGTIRFPIGKPLPPRS